MGFYLANNYFIKRLLIVMFVTSLSIQLAFAINYYKYKDENGNWVLSSSLPDGAAKNGYRVVNEKGRTVEIVEPHTTTSTRLSKQKKEEARRKWLALELPEDEKKLVLVKTFTSTSDIIRARETQVDAIQLHIDISRTNIARLEKQLLMIQTKAANLERSGHAVPAELDEEISNIQRQIVDAQDFVVQKQEKQERIRQRFSNDITNFHLLFARRLLQSWESRVNDSDKANPVTFECKEKSLCNKAWSQVSAYFNHNLKMDVEVKNQQVLVSKIDALNPGSCLWMARLSDQYRDKEYFIISESCTGSTTLSKPSCPENQLVCIGQDIAKHLSDI